MREAAAGRRFLSPPVTEIAISAYIGAINTGPFDPHETLTPRQREVLQMVAERKTTPKIAELLNISPRTVENHRASPDAETRHSEPHGTDPPRDAPWT